MSDGESSPQYSGIPGKRGADDISSPSDEIRKAKARERQRRKRAKDRENAGLPAVQPRDQRTASASPSIGRLRDGETEDAKKARIREAARLRQQKHRQAVRLRRQQELDNPVPLPHEMYYGKVSCIFLLLRRKPVTYKVRARSLFRCMMVLRPTLIPTMLLREQYSPTLFYLPYPASLVSSSTSCASIRSQRKSSLRLSKRFVWRSITGIMQSVSQTLQSSNHLLNFFCCGIALCCFSRRALWPDAPGTTSSSTKSP